MENLKSQNTSSLKIKVDNENTLNTSTFCQNNKKNTLEFNDILDIFKKKDIKSYTKQELEVFTEIFKYTGYIIDF
jgi:hypothetical protein